MIEITHEDILGTTCAVFPISADMLHFKNHHFWQTLFLEADIGATAAKARSVRILPVPEQRSQGQLSQIGVEGLGSLG